MISDELQAIIVQLKKHGDKNMHFITPATKEQIEAFEKENDIVLPEKYKEWLQFSDGGECFLPGGVQLYGVHQKPIIDVHYDDRPNDNYIVIGALSNGDPIIFEKGKEEISFYNHVAGRIEDDETYKDFFDFLKDLYNALGIGG